MSVFDSIVIQSKYKGKKVKLNTKTASEVIIEGREKVRMKKNYELRTISLPELNINVKNCLSQSKNLLLK